MNTLISRKAFIGGLSATAWTALFGGFPRSGTRRMRLGILSDVHLGVDTGKPSRAESNFLAALRFFRDAGVDGVILAGDLTECGQREEMANVVAKWNSVFPDDRLPDGRRVERLFVSGNHEFDGWRYGGRLRTDEERDRAMRNSMRFEPEKYWPEFWKEPYEPVSIREFMGYRFVLCHCYEWGRTPAFLEAHRAELEGDRPFFYVQHKHPEGTVYGRMDARAVEHAGRQLTAALARFPNAVAFSGHSHIPLSLPQSIWQGAFTSVATGSTSQPYLERNRENGGPRAGDDGREYFMCRLDMSTAVGYLMMDVYDDRLVFERRLVDPVAKCGEDWVVPLPACGDESARPYAFEPRSGASRPPEFPPDARVSVAQKEGITRRWRKERMVAVEFPRAAARGAEGVVYDYGIEVLADGQPHLTTRLYPSGVGLSESLAAAKDGLELCGFDPALFPAGRTYAFTVTPFDSWGRAGKAIKGTYEP